jgi:hypothetical protein
LIVVETGLLGASLLGGPVSGLVGVAVSPSDGDRFENRR